MTHVTVVWSVSHGFSWGLKFWLDGCHVLGKFQGHGPESEGIKKRHTDRKPGSGSQGSQLEKPQPTGSSTCLAHTVELRPRDTAYS